MTSKKRLWIVIAIIVLIVILVAGKKFFGKDENQRLVDIEEVIARDLTQSVAATGKIQPEIEVMLSSEVSGEIIEFNSSLESEPEKVNSDPYGDGWMIKIKCSDLSQIDNLMSADDYKNLIGA